MIENIWRYRQFIYSMVKRDFQSKYRGSVLGIFWMIFQPLALIAVYTIVFSEIMKSKLAGMETLPYAYSIYLCVGVLTWGLFTELTMNSINVFFNNANLMKKISFPRICLPVITMLTALLNFSIGFSLFLIFLVVMGMFHLKMFLLFFGVLAVQLIFSLSLGVGLGVLNVFFRDVGQLFNVVLQFWFWYTPVVYPANIIPQSFQWLINLNPMYHIVHAYQNLFVYNIMPDVYGLGGVLVLSLLLALWALHLYRGHVGELVDEL